MITEAFKREIELRLLHKPLLTPMFTSTFCIPERVNEYNPNMFVVYNHESGRYEIHSLENRGDTYCTQVPYSALDARILRFIWRNDIRVHGREIFKRIERQEEEFKNKKDREFKNWVEDIGKETRSMFAKDAWMGAT